MNKTLAIILIALLNGVQGSILASADVLAARGDWQFYAVLVNTIIIGLIAWSREK